MSQQIHNRQDLAIVWNESLCNCLGGFDEQLDFLKGLDHDLLALGLQGILDRNDQLGKNWENLVFSAFDELIAATIGKELGWLIRLLETLKEDR